MNAENILNDVREKYSEYLEMHKNPDALVSGILAIKIVNLMKHIEYLEKRLEHVCTH